MNATFLVHIQPSLAWWILSLTWPCPVLRKGAYGVTGDVHGISGGGGMAGTVHRSYGEGQTEWKSVMECGIVNHSE